MPITTRELDNAVILYASGRITIGQSEVLVREAVQTALDQGYLTIIIDLQEVLSLDSAGTGELVAAHLRLQVLGGRFILARLSPKVGGVLKATCLTDILEIYDDLDTALLELAAQGAPGRRVSTIPSRKSSPSSDLIPAGLQPLN